MSPLSQHINKSEVLAKAAWAEARAIYKNSASRRW